MSTPSPSFARRVFNELFRIRTKLLIVNALLVVVPLAGVSFARIYERELLRGEEEAMRVTALTLSATIGANYAEIPLNSTIDPSGMRAAAETLQAQVRILDSHGSVLTDTGGERVAVLTRGREIVSSVSVRSRYSNPPMLQLGDSVSSAREIAARPEIIRALRGEVATYTRITSGVRGVRLFLAAPIFSRDHRVIGVSYVSRSTYPVLVSLYHVRNGLERITILSLLVAFVVASFLAFTISRPLRRLTEAARRIASGERGVALKLSGRDEVSDLARAFDAMSHELDARLLYISELAANVSHEFKTPIASIHGAAELLRDGAADEPASRSRFLGNILADTDRLSRLVSRLLELSRIEASPERHVPIDYRALVEDVAERHRTVDREIQIKYLSAHAHLLGSAERLSSVLNNLIDNAFQFSGVKQAITVRVQSDEADWIKTEVTDRGPGISEANLSLIWERFFTTARDSGGTGLGLSIVRAVVESHGGKFGARSEKGSGSTFWFALPRRL